MKKIMKIDEFLLQFDEKKGYLDKLFYKKLDNDNKIRKQEIEDLTLKISNIKAKVNFLISRNILNLGRFCDKIKFIEEKLLLIKKDQKRITNAINKKKIRYTNYYLSFLDYVKENLDTTEECSFYSEEYDLFVKKI